MRKVLKDTDEVCHVWVSQSQPEGRNAGDTCSFQGRIIYTYAQPMGRLLPEQGCVLLSSRTWSITSTRHQSSLRRAVNHMSRVYAPVVGHRGEELPHHENRLWWERAFTEKMEIFTKHPRRTTVLREANHIAQAYTAYSEFFDLAWPELDYGALRERAEEEARSAENRAHLYRAAQLEAEQRRIAEQAKELALWREHTDTKNLRFAVIALRLSKDGTEIETSWGARVDVRVAAQLWKLATQCRTRNTAFVPTDRFNVDSYRLDSVNCDGSLRIGCHLIPWDELVNMSRILGLPQYSDTISQETETCITP